MLNNCGKSFCIFFRKIFQTNKSNSNRRVGSYNIITSNSSVINSNDLNKYLFADDCESCKNRNSKKLENKKKLNNNDLGVYEPPIIINSCDSFKSIDSGDDTESESDSDIETDEDIQNVTNLIQNKIKIDVDML
jgi:hypothetical protein